MLTSYGNLVDDIHSLVFVFQSAQIVYVHRGCNVVADALVKKSKNLLGASGLARQYAGGYFPVN